MEEKKMKKLITLFLAVAMLLSIIAGAIAEEAVSTDTTTDVASEAVTEPSSETEVVATTTDAIVSDETGADVEAVVADGLTDEGSEVTDAGTTPDSPLWGVERALEKINIALTFNKAKKAEKRLMHARERLLEVSEMARKGNLKAAAKAAEANAEDVEAAEEDLADEVEENGETDKVKTLESRLDRHIAVLEKVEAKLQEKGVNASGIANALAIAKAKKGLMLAKDAYRQAKKSGESVEEAKQSLIEAREGFKETRSQIREKFVPKSAEETETESSEETSETASEESEVASAEQPETSEETSTETEETSETTEGSSY